DRSIAGARREAVTAAVAQRRPDRDAAHDQRLQRIAVAGEAVDRGGERAQRDRGAFGAGRARGPAHRGGQRIDRDGLGRGRGGAEVALGVPGGRGNREREVRVVGRRDGQAGKIPAGDVDRGAAGGGREAVRAVA